MTLLWLRLVLRGLSVLVVVFAIVTLMRGGLSYTSQPQQISSDEYVIQHVVILPRTFVSLAVFGILLFSSTFLIRSRAGGTRTV
jgi:hypothetical protein